MKDIIKHIPFTTLIILFLFVCGGLYLVAYWQVFHINPSNIVTLVEIPKSFILPFSVIGAIIFIILCMILITGLDKGHSDWLNVNKPLFGPVSRVDFLVMLILPVFGLSYLFFRNTFYFWAITSTYSMHILFLKFIHMPEAVKYLPITSARFLIGYLMICCPIASFTLGKIHALQVYNNSHIRTITIPNKSNTSIAFDTSATIRFKLLGFLGDKVIISRLDNSEIIIYNQSEIGEIRIAGEEAKK